MEKYAPLLAIALSLALLVGLCFCLLWSIFIGPRRIRKAVVARLGPRSIHAAVKTSFGYWSLISLLSVASGSLAAFLSWRYLGAWLYNAVGGWQEWLAMLLSNTVWAQQFPVNSLDYAPIVPIGASLCVLLGVFAGALWGTKVGTLLASKRFLITKILFKRRGTV
jgi:hypothetical protein